MRWLILTDEAPPVVGGIATFVARVTRALADRGDEVVVVGRHRGPTTLPGARWIGARGSSFGRYAGRWLARAAGTELLRADRVLATTWVAATFATRVRSDLIITAHGSDVTRPPVRSPATFRRVWAAAGRGLALSEHLVRTLAARGVDTAPLPAPIPIRPASPPPGPARERWGFVGRLTPHKGVDRFLRWVEVAGVEGVVVGDGPIRDEAMALARRLGIRVTFTGFLSPDELARLWDELDLVVLAPRPYPDGSGAEGLGLVLLEAAGQGVPAIGCATGGVPEAVGAGLVVPTPDDAAGTVRAIRDWWTPERGLAAWAWVRDHHGTARTLATLDGERR
ncbi:MAG: glycosyltransferase family 4 protein [Myxococcota bacterium]